MADPTGPGIVDGTDNDDTIAGAYRDSDGDAVSNGPDVVSAAGGDDIVLSGDGDDTIFGGEGNDTLLGQGGNDSIYGDDSELPGGDDVIKGGDGSDTIYGGEGDDTIYGGMPEGSKGYGVPVNEKDEGDLLFGGTGNDKIYGDNGDDTIDGGEGCDTMYGGDDRDTFTNITSGDYVDGNEGGNDWDTLDLRGAAEAENPGGSYSVEYDPNNPENGVVYFYDASGNQTGSMVFRNIENVVCFTPGTRILTPMGEIPVEQLQPGDKVVTRDNGLQTIRWTGQKHLTGRNLMARPHLRPVLIRQGALGPNQPERDMMVSPNHRMLVISDRAELLFDEREVLVAAKHLTYLEGVEQVDAISIDYVHFMCDNHEVVLADGAWSESFQPGEYSINGIDHDQRSEIYELFPELREREGLEAYTAARLTLKRHEAQLIG